MFEQSILLDHAPNKKAGAVALSLSLQTLFVGTLFLVPLIYTEQLRFIQPQLPMFLPLTPPPLPLAPETTPAARPNTRPTLPAIFRVPTRIPRLTNDPIVNEAPPELDRNGYSTPGVGISFFPPTPMISVIAPPPLPKPAPDERPVDREPVHVTSDVLLAKLVHKVVPVYPRLAITTRISGTVRLTGRVGTDGLIHELQVVSGHPMLVPAALDAVRQWVYTPTLLSGRPVEVVAPIDVVFKLAQ